MKAKLFVLLFSLLLTASFIQKQNVAYADNNGDITYYQKLSVQENHNLGFTGKGVNVLLIDSGIMEAQLPNFKLAEPQVDCYDGECKVATNTATYNAHGTYVAGIIAGQTSADYFPGAIAPNVNLYSARILDDNKESAPWSPYLPDGFKSLRAAIQYGIDKNVDVINISIQVEQNLDNETTEKIKEAINDGIVIVAGAGNTGTVDPQYDNTSYLLRVPGVIGIAGLNSSGTSRWITDHSGSSTGYGVDFTTYAENIILLGNRIDSGTSYATPMATGIIPLLLEEYPEKFPRNSSRTDNVVNALKETVQPMLGYAPEFPDKTYEKNWEYGYGLLKGGPLEEPVNLTTNIKINNTIDGHDNPSDEGNITSVPSGSYQVSRAWKWDDGNKRFIWYEIDVKGDKRWVKPSIDDVGSIFKYGLFDTIYGKAYYNYLNNLMDNDEDYSHEQNISAGDHLTYRFDQLLSVNQLYVSLYGEAVGEETLVIEFLDENKNIIGKKTIRKTEFDKKFNELSQLNHVRYIKITNEGTGSINVKELEFFGTPEDDGLQPVNINTTLNIKTPTYLLYEDHKAESTSQRIDNFTLNEKLQTSKGWGWNENEHRFDWYLVSYNGQEKWINPVSMNADPLYQNGLFDTIYSKVYSSYNVGTATTDNGLNTREYFHNSDYITYRFDEPVTIEGAYVLPSGSIPENSDLKIEYFDGNQVKLGETSVTSEEYYKEYFPLTNSVSGVKTVKITNVGTDAYNINEIEFLGHSDGQPLDPVDIEQHVTITSNTFSVYDDHGYNSISEIVDNTNQTTNFTTIKGWGWNNNEQRYDWYLVNYNGEDKWINANSLNMGSLFREGFFDTAQGTITQATADWADRLMDNLWFPAIFNSNASLTYQFANPVEIKQLYVFYSGINVPQNSNLKVEYFDENNNSVGEPTIIDSEKYFKEHIILEQPIENVKSIKITNIGNDTVFLNEFEFLGNNMN